MASNLSLPLCIPWILFYFNNADFISLKKVLIITKSSFMWSLDTRRGISKTRVARVMYTPRWISGFISLKHSIKLGF